MEQLPNDFMQDATPLVSPQKKTLAQELKQRAKTSWQYSHKIGRLVGAIGAGAYMIVSNNTFKYPHNYKHAALVNHFCRLAADAFNINVTVHGNMPRSQALWVSNHVSWMDIPVVGSRAWIFFLAKAEVENWPVISFLARGGGTLFIKRGSGDSAAVKNQMAEFLKKHVPVLFFPEATTTDGRTIKKLHGKLLAAAIDTSTPIQPIVLCYVDENGKLDMQAPFIGDDNLGEHVGLILRRDNINAHLMPLEAISPIGHDMASLTQLLHQRMSEGLAALHSKVLR